MAERPGAVGCARGTQRAPAGQEVAARRLASGAAISWDACFSLRAKLAGLWQRTKILRAADLGQEKRMERA